IVTHSTPRNAQPAAPSGAVGPGRWPAALRKPMPGMEFCAGDDLLDVSGGRIRFGAARRPPGTRRRSGPGSRPEGRPGVRGSSLFNTRAPLADVLRRGRGCETPYPSPTACAARRSATIELVMKWLTGRLVDR